MVERDKAVFITRVFLSVYTFAAICPAEHMLC